MPENEKKFIEETVQFFKSNNLEYVKKRLPYSDFNIIGKSQKGILVFGINPAGNEQDENINSQYPTYFYYVDGINDDNITNANFHKMIFDVFNKITDGQIKWDWCNYSYEELNNRNIIGDINDEQKKKILAFRNNCKDNDYTIFIGEFFYYHSTSQKNLVDMVEKLHKKEYMKEYMKDMLNMHIDEIVNKGNSVECIYINNATASHWLYESLFNDEEKQSYKDYCYKGKKYRIFFGSMLSGRRAMDVFSRERLIAEIRNYLENKAK